MGSSVQIAVVVLTASFCGNLFPFFQALEHLVH